MHHALMAGRFYFSLLALRLGTVALFLTDFARFTVFVVLTLAVFFFEIFFPFLSSLPFTTFRRLAFSPFRPFWPLSPAFFSSSTGLK